MEHDQKCENSYEKYDYFSLHNENIIFFRPNNLKTLFRPITMMRPDVTQIAEISLFASGYKNARKIAKKITKFHEICSEILPPKAHYDFGLYKIF